MIDWFEALVLGVVQGATEYLPVSSSGHLVLFQHLFGLAEPVLRFDILLHVATLLAVVGYYRKDISDVCRQTFAAARDLVAGASWSSIQTQYPGFRLAWLIGVGTIPTAVLGITFEESFESLFGSVRTVGMMLWVTGLILLATRFVGRGTREIDEIGIVDALLIGFVQGLAITPGISRSGATIGVALLLGCESRTAARYSFLLSVPSIVGALLLKAGDQHGAIGLAATAIGFVAALVTGYICLAFLVKIVELGRLAWFAPYCFVVGTLALLGASFLSPTDGHGGEQPRIVEQLSALQQPGRGNAGGRIRTRSGNDAQQPSMEGGSAGSRPRSLEPGPSEG